MKKAVRKILGCTLVVSLLTSLFVTAGMLSASAAETLVADWKSGNFWAANDGAASDSTKYPDGLKLSFNGASDKWNYQIKNWSANQKAIKENDTLKITIYSEDMKAPTVGLCLSPDDSTFYNGPFKSYTKGTELVYEAKYSDFKLSNGTAFDPAKYEGKNVSVMLMFRPNGDEAIASGWSVEFTDVFGYKSTEAATTTTTEAEETTTTEAATTAPATEESDEDYKILDFKTIDDSKLTYGHGRIKDGATFTPSDLFDPLGGYEISGSSTGTDWRDMQFTYEDISIPAGYEGIHLKVKLDNYGEETMNMNSQITIRLVINDDDPAQDRNDTQFQANASVVYGVETDIYIPFSKFSSNEWDNPTEETIPTMTAEDIANVNAIGFCVDRWTDKADAAYNFHYWVSDTFVYKVMPTTTEYTYPEETVDPDDDNWNDNNDGDDNGNDDGNNVSGDDNDNPGTGVAAPIGVALLAGFAGTVVFLSKKRK